MEKFFSWLETQHNAQHSQEQSSMSSEFFFVVIIPIAITIPIFSCPEAIIGFPYIFFYFLSRSGKTFQSTCHAIFSRIMKYVPSVNYVFWLVWCQYVSASIFFRIWGREAIFNVDSWPQELETAHQNQQKSIICSKDWTGLETCYGSSFYSPSKKKGQKFGLEDAHLLSGEPLF